MSYIEIEHLTKKFKQPVRQPGLKGAVKHFFTQKYEEKLAVNNISFSLDAGERVAYVGANGAGKSTTIKMMSGILIPTSGIVRVNGIEPYKNRIENSKNIGAVFGQRTQLWWDLPVIESYLLLKDMYEIPDEVYEKNMARFKELLGLDEFMHLSTRKISLGQRMRADIAASLLHGPQVLYLDEPTIGLDVAVKERVRKFIRQLNDELNTTIILTTHDLNDIEEVCERIIMIDKGQVIYDGSLETLKNTYARKRTITVQTEEEVEHLNTLLGTFHGVLAEKQNDRSFALSFDRFQLSSREIVSHLIAHYPVKDFQTHDAQLEDVIKLMYEDSGAFIGGR